MSPFEKRIIDSPEVRTLTKQIIEEARSHDPLDAYRDVLLAAEVLKYRLRDMQKERYQSN